MKVSHAIIVLASVGSLALFAWGESRPSFEVDEGEVKRHWQVVHDYRNARQNPDNWERDPKTGFNVRAVPDISVSLAYLVAAGEIVYADVILPEVPRSRASVMHWLTWAENRNDIWEMSGPTGSPFEVRGELPLHLKIWHDETAHADIQKLIQDLEALPKKGT